MKTAVVLPRWSLAENRIDQAYSLLQLLRSLKQGQGRGAREREKQEQKLQCFTSSSRRCARTPPAFSSPLLQTGWET